MKKNYYAVFTYRQPYQPLLISQSLKETSEIQRILKIHQVHAFYLEVDLEILNHFTQDSPHHILDIGDSDYLLKTFSELSDLLSIEIYSPEKSWSTLKNNHRDQDHSSSHD